MTKWNQVLLSTQRNLLLSLETHSQILLDSAQTLGQRPFTQPNTGISGFSIPWEKLPARISQAIARGDLAQPEDKRTMMWTVVDAL